MCTKAASSKPSWLIFLVTATAALVASTLARADDPIRLVAHPPADITANPFYVANRAPLAPSPFMKLPIGSITPKGWLRIQLENEANGMTGHLPEVSHFVKFEGNAWVAPDGKGANGWEETPYWLKGYGDLGYVLKDPKITAEARRWIEGVLSTQQPDGYFGPISNKTSLDRPRAAPGSPPGQPQPDGFPDLWPHMVMLNVLQSFHETTGDPHVIPFMTKYFQWMNTLPPQTFSRGYWPKTRWGDNIESIYWLYNRTGDESLLPLAKRIHDNMQDWSTGVHDRHNVNISQAFREPTVYWQQALEDNFLRGADRNYHEVLDTYGQFPGGGFAGDENTRNNYTDPHQGFETCGMVEFMHSFEMLTKITGDAAWSDRCEDIAFNSLPAAITPDFKALHYLTAPNQVQLDRANHSPGIQNRGTMFSFSPGEVYRCCQHNVSHGWPYYAEELWLATADRGLCASLYAASEVTARVADGTTVKISEETDYPFGDKITLNVTPETPVAFPLYLRLPGWARSPEITINGRPADSPNAGAGYLVVNRAWKAGDTLTLRLPMQVTTRTWPKNHDAVSIHYGPLAFSLRIGEKWTRYGGTDAWPEHEVTATTPWNYGLDLAHLDLTKVAVSKKPLAAGAGKNPFKPEDTPIELRLRARKIPNWQLDSHGLAAALQNSPIKTDQPAESVSLIPMGAARLRISIFPTLGTGENAKSWTSN